MALVNEYPTIAAVMDQMQKDHHTELRGYVQCSGLGSSCERQLQYQFWWASQEIHPASTLMKFDDGHRTEDLTNKRFKATPGVDLRPFGPDGRQWGVASLSGHLRGHLDGLVLGLLEAPKTWHVYEVKCVGDARMRKLERLLVKHGEKEALKEWSKVYYTQAQLYMGLTKLKRHYLVCCTAGGRDMISVRTNFNKKDFLEAFEKASRLLKANELPPRLSEDPEFFQCKWCQFSELCHEKKTAKANCRTCAHSTPVVDPDTMETKDFGVWRCEFHNKKISMKDQKKGCPKHLFKPDLIPWATVKEMDKERNRITYQFDGGDQTFTNCELNNWSDRDFTSKDLQWLDPDKLVNDTHYLTAMAAFTPGAEILEVKPPDNGIPFDDDIPF